MIQWVSGLVDQSAEDEMVERFRAKLGESLLIPLNFAPTVEGFQTGSRSGRPRMPQSDVRNPQTEQFLELLGIPYNLHYGGKEVPSVSHATFSPGAEIET